jgi:hypothetical protein
VHNMTYSFKLGPRHRRQHLAARHVADRRQRRDVFYQHRPGILRTLRTQRSLYLLPTWHTTRLSLTNQQSITRSAEPSTSTSKSTPTGPSQRTAQSTTAASSRRARSISTRSSPRSSWPSSPTPATPRSTGSSTTMMGCFCSRFNVCDCCYSEDRKCWNRKLTMIDSGRYECC